MILIVIKTLVWHPLGHKKNLNMEGKYLKQLFNEMDDVIRVRIHVLHFLLTY